MSKRTTKKPAKKAAKRPTQRRAKSLAFGAAYSPVRIEIANTLSRKEAKRLANSIGLRRENVSAAGSASPSTGDTFRETVRTVDDVAARASRYGVFTRRARIAQAIRRAMMAESNWDSLADDQKHALEMIAEKVSRILNGNPEYHDSWDDIAGYARLVSERLQGRPI